MSAVSNARFHEYGATNKPITKDTFDVFEGYLDKKRYGFAKAVYVLGVDVPRALGLMSQDNQMASLIKKHATLFKLSRSPADFFNYFNETVRSAWSCLTGTPIIHGKKKTPKVQPWYQVIRDAGGLVNPVAEMATFLSMAILFIPNASLHLLKGINGIVLTFLMGWDACESVATLGKYRVCDLTNDDKIVKRRFKNVGALLKLITQVSFVALGVLIALSVFASVAVDSLIMTALSATTVVFSILEFYHSNIGQEKKIT